jgi:hypothetical protein
MTNVTCDEDAHVLQARCSSTERGKETGLRTRDDLRRHQGGRWREQAHHLEEALDAVDAVNVTADQAETRRTPAFDLRSSEVLAGHERPRTRHGLGDAREEAPRENDRRLQPDARPAPCPRRRIGLKLKSIRTSDAATSPKPQLASHLGVLELRPVASTTRSARSALCSPLARCRMGAARTRPPAASNTVSSTEHPARSVTFGSATCLAQRVLEQRPAEDDAESS